MVIVSFPKISNTLTAIFRQQIPHQHQPLIDRGDKRIRPFAPGVPVGDFFKDIGFEDGVAGLISALIYHSCSDV
jgi:hypothetical protein